MAATVNKSIKLNIQVEINREPAQALINSGANKVYIISAYIKRQGFKLQ